MTKKTFCIPFAFFLALTMFGCGDSGPRVTPVTITVTHKGSPLAGATVSAASSDGQGNSASALTDSSGVATLQTPARGPGVLPGEYNIAVTKWESYTVPAPSSDDPSGVATEQKNILPAKYADHSTSGFNLTVGTSAVQETFDISE